ncbi:LD-carboxypeptidase, partial [Achromobacter sp. Bel]|nr:LD-carboxypeptidase [Achromobacter sp. Bel]
MNLSAELAQNQNPGRRGFLKQTGALCLTALALSGCASRAPGARQPAVAKA